MNEKIKELMKEANLTPYYDSQEKDIDKFAELIIRECANQILDQGIDYLDWQPSKTGIRPEYYEMAQHIKHHFGIE